MLLQVVTGMDTVGACLSCRTHPQTAVPAVKVRVAGAPPCDVVARALAAARHL